MRNNFSRRIEKLEQALPETSLDETNVAMLSDGRSYYQGIIYDNWEDIPRPLSSSNFGNDSVYEMPYLLTPEAEKRLLERLQS
ncbi:MAG: hypothetical protein M0024_10185 [Nitrospiraceae bacterium]|nr:hypothetical protein [Nitrospiraceae bacterium]